MDDNEEKWRYENLPIPSYEEATSSRPTSAQQYRGPEEVSDDAERQGLLNRDQPRTNGAYHAPGAESARSSLDSDLHLPEVEGDGDSVRRNIEELDYLDPSAELERGQSRFRHRARIRKNLSERLASIGASLSSLHLPSWPSSWRQYLPFAPSSYVRLPVLPEGYTISLPIIARLIGLLIIGMLIYVLFFFDILPSGAHMRGQHFDPESVRAYVQEHIDAESIQGYLWHITSYDHVAGTEGDYYLAKWMEEKWREANMDDVALLEYFVYLNYPVEGGRSVDVVAPLGESWSAQLEENHVDLGGHFTDRKQTLAWHGSSRNGDVTGHLIYANGGAREDFKYLQDKGVVTNGSIALVRYYGSQGDRSLKIKAAEEAGCVGVLIYSDPADDGSVKGLVWPDGPWRPEDSLQRGGVAMSSFVVGDPLTPGWASTQSADRVAIDNNPGLHMIPSLPLAWRDAKVLLEKLQNHGHKVPEDWELDSSPGTPERWTGSDSFPTVRLKNQNDENQKQPIWNLHALIEGIETGVKKVIVGNHRDSWCFGSVDPGSGSAVLMEVVNIFGQLRALGWRPLRTIEFVSWDAEEYNLIGSTEYVEDNIDYLRDNGVAYLNVDVGVFGPNFRASASPVFSRALQHVLGRVSDPASNATLKSIWENSSSKLGGLGAGSDYVAFQDMAGTSSIDFGFEGPENGYPYHSCYETFQWMKAFGDPDMQYHRTAAQVWALLILEIADRPIIPYDLRNYAAEVQQYIKVLTDDMIKAHERAGDTAGPSYGLQLLHEAADLFAKNAETFHLFEDVWTSNVLGRGGFESTAFAFQRIEYNDRITRFETDLLDIPRSLQDEEQHGVSLDDVSIQPAVC